MTLTISASKFQQEKMRLLIICGKAYTRQLSKQVEETAHGLNRVWIFKASLTQYQHVNLLMDSVAL